MTKLLPLMMLGPFGGFNMSRDDENKTKKKAALPTFSWQVVLNLGSPLFLIGLWLEKSQEMKKGAMVLLKVKIGVGGVLVQTLMTQTWERLLICKQKKMKGGKLE